MTPPYMDGSMVLADFYKSFLMGYPPMVWEKHLPRRLFFNRRLALWEPESTLLADYHLDS